jgi:hypothetical protein
MPQCLFCLVDREELTDEHVFPAVLGGHLQVKNAVCANCNNGFSRAFEQAIATRLADFRRILRIPDRYGKVPELLVKVEVDGKQLDAKLLRNGAIQLKPVITVNKGNGVTEITYEHVTEWQQNKLREQANEQGVELAEHTTPGVEVVVWISGHLDFIDSPEMFRTVAKIAYIGLAFRMGRRVAISDGFGELRRYIQNGEGISRTKLFLNERFLEASGQGPHQHSIVIAARNDKHRVDAIVRLFGGLCYFVNLTEQYEGADFYDTLVCDAQRGEVNSVLVTNLQTEFLQIEDVSESQDTVWNDRLRAGDWFIRFVDRQIRSKIAGG